MKVLPLLALMAAPLVGHAQFVFSTANGVNTIVQYSGSDPAVVIPATTNGLPVTAIAGFAFQSRTSLTNVTIPSGITNIGAGAFYGCSSLAGITVDPANPSYTSTNGILFNKNQTIIVEYPGGLGGNYTIPSTVTNIGGAAFSSCQKLTTVTIPNSVLSIEGSAFNLCVNLTNVTIGSSVAGIAASAFDSCVKLAGVYYLGNAPLVGANVFASDGHATNYYLPGTSGWISPFAGRPAVMLNPPNPAGLLQVTFSPTSTITNGAQWRVDGGVTQTNGAIVLGLAVGNHTVSYGPVNGWAKPADQIVAVTANATNVTTGVYGQVTYATNGSAIILLGYTGPGSAVILPDAINGRPVAGITFHAFNNPNLTSVTISSSITNIGYGNSALSGCQNLTEINVDANSPFFSSMAGVLFDKNQTALVQYPRARGGSYTVPDSVTEIRNESFLGCASLTGISFGPNLLSIGDLAFDGCSSLTSLAIPNKVVGIGNDTFRNCAGLTNLTFGTSLTTILDGAFVNCPGLTTIVLPRSLTLLGSGAFASCPGLTGIYFLGNPPNLFDDAFGGDGNATVYYLPGTTGWDTTFAGAPAALWNPQATTFIADGSRFGFNITGPTNATIVVEACADLAHPTWLPVSTNILSSDGTSFFSDPQWANYPGRLYRFRSP